MDERDEHVTWREGVVAAVIERRPPNPQLAVHLASCAECSDAWRQLSGASAKLITAARVLPLGSEPPPALRERVLAARDRAAAVRSRGILPTATPPGAARNRAGRRWPGRLAWASGGAAFGAALGAAAVLLLAVLGTAQTAPLRYVLTGTALAPAVHGTAVVARLPDGSLQVELALSGVPPSDAGHFYELWFVGDRGRVSAGTFRADGSPVDRTFSAAADLAVYPHLGITLQADNGDPRPSDQKVAGSS